MKTGSFVFQGIYGREIAESLFLRTLSDDLLKNEVESYYLLNKSFVQDDLFGTVMLETDSDAMTGELVFYPYSGEVERFSVPTVRQRDSAASCYQVISTIHSSN